MIFDYVAYDSHGSKVEEFIEARDEQHARQLIVQKGFILVSVSPQKSHSAKNKGSLFKRKISLQQLEFITSELAILLKSGVRLDKGLDILVKGAEPEAAVMLTKISEKVKSGSSVSESFEQFGDTFDALYINMIRLGEASGQLDEVFSRLSHDLKFRRQLTSKIVQSITYPAVILIVSILCVLFVFNYIVPQMSAIFDRSKELPIYTEILLAVSDWFIAYQWFLAGGIVVAGYAFFQALKQEDFKRKVSEFGLKLPLIGRGIILVERIRFNSSMSMMLSSGVPLIESLNLSASNVKNDKIKSLVNIASNKVKQGGVLSSALQTTPLFTEFNISLVEVGEESGELEPVFEEIAERSRQDFEGWTQTLTSMIEPILIMIMGGIVGSVVVVMLMSIVSTNDVGL